MASYLKKYVDRVHDVPPQLQRLFKLIRDLDERAASLQAAVEAKVRASLKASGAGGGGASKKQRAKAEAQLRDEVAADTQKILGLSEEKARIAAQIYDFVDGHIRALDEDLRVFDGELYADRARLGLKVRGALVGWFGAVWWLLFGLVYCLFICRLVGLSLF
jgi:cell division septum initiation protein DivIVA